jgi:hypothetical protein
MYRRAVIQAIRKRAFARCGHVSNEVIASYPDLDRKDLWPATGSGLTLADLDCRGHLGPSTDRTAVFAAWPYLSEA